jgi:hypothetical protein
VARVLSNTAGSRNCRFLGSSGQLGATRPCDDRVFLNAKLGKLRDGKVPWTFRKRRLDLPAGSYVVTALATDSDNNGETAIRRYNQKRFRIR